MARFAGAPPLLCPRPTPTMPPLGPSALTPSPHETSNYNSRLQLIFTRLFVSASAASPSTKSIPNTNSAPGLSLLWIWSLNSRQCLVPSPSRKSTLLKLSSQPLWCTSSISAIFAATYTLITSSSPPLDTLSPNSLASIPSPGLSNPSRSLTLI